jgi:histone H3/H4
MSNDHTKRTIIRPNINAEDYQSVVPVELMEIDTLVVVSKIKKLIREQAAFNTSQCAIEALTQKIVLECLKAIEHAKEDGRKTVMGRDF